MTHRENLPTRRNAIWHAMSVLTAAKAFKTVTALTGLSTLGITTSGCMGDTTYDQGELDAFEPYWTYRADRMESYQTENYGTVRTKNDPQGHNPAVHVPIVSVQNGLLTATVDHVMELDHWITTIYARDITTGRVFYLKEFLPTELAPMTEKGASIEVQIPPGILQIAVFAFCNKHELWWSGAIDLS